MSDTAQIVGTVADPRRLWRERAMSRPQKIAIGVTFALSALDGYDVLAATLAAPSLVAEWGVDHASLGFLLSMGLVGMAIGSLALAPLADVVGRRRLIFGCLGLMTVGMGMSGLTHEVAALSFWRIVTGLGIGAMIPVINPLATEFANERRRDLAVSLMAVGYPVGGVVGGAAATLLLRHLGWPSLFAIGALLALVMAAVVARWLPEPLSFLIERPRPGALRRVNALLERCGFAPVDALPPPVAPKGRVPIAALFAGDTLASTLRVTAVNLLYVVAVYFMLSWIPQLIADRGFSTSQAASVSLSANLAGIVGGIAFGWIAGSIGSKRVAIGIFLGFAITILLFSRAPSDLPILRLFGALTGFFLFGGMCALHAIVARSFSDHVRASGAGVVMGVGRAGSAIAPLVTGVLLSVGIGQWSISIVMAFIVLCAAALLATHHFVGAKRSYA